MARMARSASFLSAAPYSITRSVKRSDGADNTPTETTPSHPGHIRTSSRHSCARSARLIAVFGWSHAIGSIASPLTRNPRPDHATHGGGSRWMVRGRCLVAGCRVKDRALSNCYPRVPASSSVKQLRPDQPRGALFHVASARRPCPKQITGPRHRASDLNLGALSQGAQLM